MGAVKELAIELEANMADVASLTSTTVAYRLGMLEACRLITETGRRFDQAEETLPTWAAVHGAWQAVFDAVSYLREVEEREIVSGPQAN